MTMQNIENTDLKEVEQTIRGQILNLLWHKERSVRSIASYTSAQFAE